MIKTLFLICSSIVDTTCSLPVEKYFSSATFNKDQFLILSHSGTIYQLKLPKNEKKSENATITELNGSGENNDQTNDNINGNVGEFTDGSGDEVRYELQVVYEMKEKIVCSALLDSYLAVVGKQFHLISLNEKIEDEKTKAIEGVVKLFQTKQS